MVRPQDAEIPVLGWREWVSLPDLGIQAIKAKVDTGARSSSLHAFDVETYLENGIRMVRFKVHPFQRDTVRTVTGLVSLLDSRSVRSSGGHETMRPVIMTTMKILGRLMPIELTLASRDTMGFRMLLGRQALREHFLVDPGRSFLAGKPRAARRRRRASN